MQNKKALIANIILLVMEIAGLIAAIYFEKGFKLKYYTNWSNYLGLLSAILFIINYYLEGKNSKFNNVCKILKLTATLCLSLTFLVVLFMFVPYDHFNFLRWMIFRNYFSFHLFSPIICFISFCFFEKYDFKYKYVIFEGFTFTIIYTIVISILILAKKVEAPYLFLDYYAYKWYTNVATIAIIGILTIGLLYLLVFLNKRDKTKDSE